MSREARSDVKVCCLVLVRAFQLLLTSTSLSSSCKLLLSRLRVVNGRVLAKNKVGASELIYLRLSLRLGIELTSELVALLNLLSKINVRHFNLFLQANKLSE